ncbi:hypothetical protein O3P69_013613 [Scylla paramamosain]|uniref:Uncharacterized protein n=1 Tax=Scylla paramamosain TaxID=85552 RepID=A0AAW0SNX4_SCYPA
MKLLILALLVAVTLGASYRPRNRREHPVQLDNDAGGKVLLVNRRDTTHAVKQHYTQDGHSLGVNNGDVSGLSADENGYWVAQ